MQDDATYSSILIATRFADEGVPICAIARALKIPSDDIREVLRDALDEGIIVEYPREDWPPSTSRGQRAQQLTGLAGDEAKLLLACGRYFGTTKQQSAVLSVLLRRSEATKEQLHHVIEQSRPEGKEQTDIKLVDVLVCILRKKLKVYDLGIKTLWGVGYLMEPQDRHKAVGWLEEFMKVADNPALSVQDAA